MAIHLLFIISDEFPQVPVKTNGKSRIAFVLFKTHQTAKEVKKSFKKLVGRKHKKLVRLDSDLQNFLEDSVDYIVYIYW